MSRPALTGRKLNAEEADSARGAAVLSRSSGGASANFRFRVGGGNFYFVRAAMTTAVAVMAVATAVVDGNAA
jgi:hypothetical protein